MRQLFSAYAPKISLVVFLVFVIVSIYGIFHATQGIDTTDEGYYLAASMRYTLGDIPGKDETMHLVTLFDVLLSPLFLLHPNISLFQMRIVGLIVHIVPYILLYIAFARFAPRLIIALSLAFLSLVNNYYGILTPSYNLLSSSCILASIALLVIAINTGKTRLSFISGITSTLAALSYFPMIILPLLSLILLLFFLLTQNDNKNESKMYSIARWYAAGFVSSVLLAIGVLYVTGVLYFFTQNITSSVTLRILQQSGLYGRLQNIITDVYNLTPRNLIVLLSLIGTLVLATVPRAPRSLVIVSGVSIYILLAPTLLFGSFVKNVIAFVFWLGLAMALPLVYILKRKGLTTKNFTILYTYMLGFSSAAIYALSSTNRIASAIQGLAPLFVVSIILLRESINSKLRTTDVLLGIFLFFLFMFGLHHNLTTIYRDGPIETLNTPFQHQKLQGVYSSENRVRVLENVLDSLDAKVQRGDYLLAYYNVPLIYFLTQTRPAVAAVWVNGYHTTPKQQSLLVNRMIDEKKLPDYALRLNTTLAGDWSQTVPIIYTKDKRLTVDAFITSQYSEAEIIGPFEIWQKKPYTAYVQTRALSLPSPAKPSGLIPPTKHVLLSLDTSILSVVHSTQPLYGSLFETVFDLHYISPFILFTVLFSMLLLFFNFFIWRKRIVTALIIPHLVAVGAYIGLKYHFGFSVYVHQFDFYWLLFKLNYVTFLLPLFVFIMMVHRGKNNKLAFLIFILTLSFVLAQKKNDQPFAFARYPVKDMVQLLAITPSQRAPVIQNASFERRLNGWQPPVDVTSHLPGEAVFSYSFSNDAIDRSRSLVLSAKNHTMAVSTKIKKLEQGKLYHLTFDAKQMKGIYEPTYYLDAPHTEIIENQRIPLQNNWVRYGVYFIPHAHELLFVFYSKGYDSVNSVAYDNITFWQ